MHFYLDISCGLYIWRKSSLLCPKLIQILDICGIFSCICKISVLRKRICGKFLLFRAEIGWRALFFCICPGAGFKRQPVMSPITASPVSVIVTSFFIFVHFPAFGVIVLGKSLEIVYLSVSESLERQGKMKQMKRNGECAESRGKEYGLRHFQQAGKEWET